MVIAKTKEAACKRGVKNPHKMDTIERKKLLIAKNKTILCQAKTGKWKLLVHYIYVYHYVYESLIYKYRLRMSPILKTFRELTRLISIFQAKANF